MRRAAIPIVVVLIAAVIFGATVREALAFTWGDFADLCRNASAEELEAVLKRENVSISAVQDDKTSLLMVAAKVTPNPDVIQALVRLGADPNARREDGVTALMLAAVNNSNPEVIAALVKAGADPLIRDNNGNSALNWAFRWGGRTETKAFALFRQHYRAALIEAFSKRFSEKLDGAFGPDLTGMGWLRIGTRCRNFSEIYDMGNMLSNFSFQSDNYIYISVYALNTSTPLVRMRYDENGSVRELRYSFPRKQGPASLKEEIQDEEQAKNMTGEDWLKRCEPYAPFVVQVEIEMEGGRNSLSFLRGVKDKSYRLIECELCEGFWRDFWNMDETQYKESRALAATILEKFGQENGIDDMYVTNNGWIYFWKDPSKGYALCISGGRCCIFPIVDEHTLYPLKYFSGRWGGRYLFVSKTELRKAWGTDTEIPRFGYSDADFDLFLEREVLGIKNASMGFTGFGDSLELDH